MATSNHHAAHQHSRYPLLVSQNSRDEAVRLPSIKDLNFQYARHARHPQDPVQIPSQDHPDVAARAHQPWTRSAQPPSPSTPAAVHQAHHQQQHTPPLSASHDSAPQKLDNGPFMPTAMPMSAQSTPVSTAMSLASVPRTEDVPQPKRQRRGTEDMGPPRDQRTSHQTTYPPPYAYSHPQSAPPPPPQAPNPYNQIQNPVHHSTHSHSQPAIDQVHQVPVSTHPSYGVYQPYPPPRVHPQSQPQLQHPHHNPYPSPGPPTAPPPQGPWEQQQQHPLHVQPAPHQPPHHSTSHHPPPSQPPSHQVPPHQIPPPQAPSHQAPPPHQPAPHQAPHHSGPPPPHSHHLPPPPPPAHSHIPQHVLSHPSAPGPPVPSQSLQHTMPPPQHHPQHTQHVTHSAMPPLPPTHPVQHPHIASQPQHHPQYTHQQAAFVRTTPIVPTTVETRTTYSVNDPTRMASTRETTMGEIVRHCHALYSFANRYVQLQQTMPDICPPPEELTEMSHRASEVVRLLDEYRRMNLSESERSKLDTTSAAAAVAVAAVTAMSTPSEEHDHRPPKRPWEDISHEEIQNSAGTESATLPEPYPTPVEKVQTTAEQDMEIIRSKRATSTAGVAGVAGQQKSKYRKRSRATPPGKCHSCNIRETPEWRRGPDGARTLCNACGLHYAKLQRKRDKLAGPNGEAPRIDLETLRASARAADVDKGGQRKVSRSSQQSTEPTSPLDTASKTLVPQSHHQGSFQLLPVPMPPPHPPTQEPTPPIPEPGRGMPQSGPNVVLSIPPPPWSSAPTAPTSAPPRGYAPEQLEHQSFLRTSHPTNASPR